MENGAQLPETLAVYGNSQAEAIALVLRSLPVISKRCKVVYVADEGAAAGSLDSALSTCSQVWEQQVSKPLDGRVKLPKKVKRLRFPTLELHLLWPFNCINPFNKADPVLFPFGRFPYGDSFMVSCVRNGIAAELVLQYYLPAQWPSTWPNLDRLFQSETTRLSSVDTRNDVKIGSFILKYFRKKRLFWAVNVPSNVLLAEVIYRLLHASLGTEHLCERKEIEEALFYFGPRDLLGGVSVPVHPLVAKHFNLEWYRTDDRYGCPADQAFTFEEYFTEMLRDAASFEAAGTGRKEA